MRIVVSNFLFTSWRESRIFSLRYFSPCAVLYRSHRSLRSLYLSDKTSRRDKQNYSKISSWFDTHLFFLSKKISNQNDQSTAVSGRTQLFRAFQRKTQNICQQILVRSALETLLTLKSATCTSQMGLIEVMFAFAFAF